MMSRNTVIFSGYVANEEGLRVWPSKKLTQRWADLTKVQTVRLPDGRAYQTTLGFGAGRKLTLHGSKFLPSTLGRFAELLALACAHAPAGTPIDPLTRDIAAWGGREVQQRVRRLAEIFPSADEWLMKARFYRARLEYRKARKSIEALIERHRDNREAWVLRLELLAESGAGQKEQLAQAVAAHALFPGDRDIRTHCLGLRLLANEAIAVPEAEARLAQEPDNYALGFALAGYFYRQKNFARAITVAEALSDQEGGLTEGAKAARDYRAYLQQYASSGVFRAKERFRYWAKVALVVLPLILVAGSSFWRFYDRQNRDTKQREQHVRRHEEFRAQLEKANREFEETTGKLMGDYPTVKIRADAGEANAQYTVAGQLFSGRQKALKDPVAALKYLELAAGQHHRAAVMELAERLLEGREIGRDDGRGLALLQEAVALGSPRAASLLGGIYREGKLVPKDDTKAFGLFEQAAAGGHAWAQVQLGWARERGEGVEQDLSRALEHYRKAAESDFRWAHERLVQLLGDQKQPVYEPKEAWRWVMRGAKKGSMALQIHYAAGLLAGQEASPEERKQAFQWLERAAAKDQAMAIYYLGWACWLGWERPVALVEGARQFGLAADKGYAPALLVYARCLAAGVGMGQDLPMARQIRAKLSEKTIDKESLLKLDALIDALSRPTIMDANQGTQKPSVIWQEPPVYPGQCARLGQEGEVVLEFIVGPDGHTRDIQVIRSAWKDLEGPAIVAVAFWRFQPGQLNGKFVSVRVSQPVMFSLKNSQSKDSLRMRVGP